MTDHTPAKDSLPAEPEVSPSKPDSAQAAPRAEEPDSSSDIVMTAPPANATTDGDAPDDHDRCGEPCRPAGIAILTARAEAPAPNAPPTPYRPDFTLQPSSDGQKADPIREGQKEQKKHADPWASLGAAAPQTPETEKADDKARDFVRDAEPTKAGDPPADADPFGLEEQAETARPAVKPGKKRKSPSSGTGPFAGRALGPVMKAVPMCRDEDDILGPTPHTVFSRIFSVLALFPLLPLLALLAAQVIFTLDTRALWYSDEVRYANAFQNLVQGGHWLVLQLNDSFYPDKPPLFFWFLEGIRTGVKYIIPGGIPGQAASPMLFSVGMALSGLLLLLASHAMAVFVARVDRRTSLAAGIVLLTGFFLSGLLHYLRMDILFAACITLSHVFLYHGWMRRRATKLLLIGFILAGTATLIKGPLGFAFPLLTGIVFMIWQGRFVRFFYPDNLFALLVGLAVPAAWLAAAWTTAGDPFLNNILHKQILARALDAWHHGQPWYHYLITFPLIWLPWTLLLLFLPWGRLFSRSTRQALTASRTPEAAGLAYLWCAFVPGLVLLSAVSIKLPVYCLPLFPPLAVLSARALLRLSPLACKCLQWLLALLFFALAILLMIAPALPKTLLPIPVVPAGNMLLGGVCLLAACALGFLATPRRSEGLLLIIALFMAAFSYPAWSAGAPSLDVFMSPKAQALVIKKYREAGYYPASYKVYRGAYTYYAGVVRDLDEWKDVTTLIAKQPKLILAMQATYWDGLTEKPAGFAEVHRQTIAERAYVLVARPPLEGAPASKPAAQPAAGPKTEAPAAGTVPPKQGTPAAPKPETPAMQPAASPKPEAPAKTEAPVAGTAPPTKTTPATPETSGAPKPGTSAAPAEPKASPKPEAAPPVETTAPAAPKPETPAMQPAASPKPEAPARPEAAPPKPGAS